VRASYQPVWDNSGTGAASGTSPPIVFVFVHFSRSLGSLAAGRKRDAASMFATANTFTLDRGCEARGGPEQCL
jgi:hypothetical protein